MQRNGYQLQRPLDASRRLPYIRPVRWRPSPGTLMYRSWNQAPQPMAQKKPCAAPDGSNRPEASLRRRLLRHPKEASPVLEPHAPLGARIPSALAGGGGPARRPFTTTTSITWAHSSDGQSCRLITGRSLVQIQVGPSKRARGSIGETTRGSVLSYRIGVRRAFHVTIARGTPVREE